MDGVY